MEFGHYKVALLDPRPAKRAEMLEFLHSVPVLGIEVTVPELAIACQLGNVDPQHTGGNVHTSAVEEAVVWPLPPDGTVMATVRPDADAYGAMAVFQLRRAEQDHAGLLRNWAGVRHRIRCIGLADRSPPPDDDEVTPLQALCAVCLASGPEQGVTAVRDWLLTRRWAGMDQVIARLRAERREVALLPPALH